MSNNCELAIVLPVHNEGDTIEDTIKEIHDKIMSVHPTATLKVYEDGSEDETKEILISLQAKLPRLSVSLGAERKGYVQAVKDALTSVGQSYRYVLFLDSDGQYDPGDFYRFWHEMGTREVDIVQGLRMNRSEPFYRVLLSKGLRAIERFMFDLESRDVTSAFRLMKTTVAMTVASQVRYSKHNFWLEFSARARALGYRAIEVPVTYRSRKGGSKVYSLTKMPKIVWEEGKALINTWLELRNLI